MGLIVVVFFIVLAFITAIVENSKKEQKTAQKTERQRQHWPEGTEDSFSQQQSYQTSMSDPEPSWEREHPWQTPVMESGEDDSVYEGDLFRIPKRTSLSNDLKGNFRSSTVDWQQVKQISLKLKEEGSKDQTINKAILYDRQKLAEAIVLAEIIGQPRAKRRRIR